MKPLSVRQAALALLPPSHDEVAQCARDLWIESGQPRAHDQAIWLEAERRLVAARREPVAMAAVPVQPRRRGPSLHRAHFSLATSRRSP